MESSFLNPQKAVQAAGVHEGMKVADFAPGAGFFTRAAARAVGENGVVWAVDCHRELLARLKTLAAAEGSHNVEVVHGSVEKPGGSHLPEDHFDLVLAANLLFTLEDRPAALREVRRVLRRGGMALFIDWKNSFGGLGPQADHIVSAAEARALCEQEGLSYGGDIPAGEYHWGFVVRKKQ